MLGVAVAEAVAVVVAAAAAAASGVAAAVVVVLGELTVVAVVGVSAEAVAARKAFREDDIIPMHIRAYQAPFRLIPRVSLRDAPEKTLQLLPKLQG